MLWKFKNSDLEEFFVYPKRFLTITGCWPTSDSKFTWLYKLHRHISIHLISFLFTTTLLLNLLFSLNDVASATDAIYFTTTNITYITKLVIFYRRKHVFEVLLEDMNQPMFSTSTMYSKSYLKYWRKRAVFMSRIYAYGILICCILFALVPLVDEQLLLVPGWFPFEIKKFTFKYITAYLFQFYGITLCGVQTISFDVMPSIFMNVGCSQIYILKHTLRNAIENAEREVGEIYGKRQKPKMVDELLSKEEENVLMQTLSRCVQHHVAIIRMFHKIQKLFSIGMFAQFVTCGISLCMSGMQLLMTPLGSVKFLMCVLYLFLLVMQVSLYCFNGNDILEQTSTISDSCYEMEWYRCSAKVKKTLFLMMERSKRPNIIVAGGIFNCTVQTLTILLRTAYSYFTILYRLYQK